MVKVISWKPAQNKEGKDFISIQLQGGIEAIQSQQTGKMYLTAKTAWIPSTFDVSTATELVGTTLPGEIRKVHCEPYDYTVKETGEVIQLTYRFEYLPEGAMPQVSPALQSPVVNAFASAVLE